MVEILGQETGPMCKKLNFWRRRHSSTPPHSRHNRRHEEERGTIIRWSTDKGFGFMRSAQTPGDIFFHVRDWRGEGAQPTLGWLVDYEEIQVGGKGLRGMA